MRPDNLRDLIDNSQDRIQIEQWFLRDIGNLRATNLPQCALPGTRHVCAPEIDGAFHLRLRRQRTNQCLSSSSLTAPGFAQQPHYFGGMDRKTTPPSTRRGPLAVLYATRSASTSSKVSSDLSRKATLNAFIGAADAGLQFGASYIISASQSFDFSQFIPILLPLL